MKAVIMAGGKGTRIAKIYPDIPKPGMLLAASKKYNIDLSISWMVGDGENDIRAGKNAGCKTCYLSEEGEKDYGQDLSVNSLLCFANMLKRNKINEG